jgi:large subunit ribosomal protein L6
MPIQIPTGVEVRIDNSNRVEVKGPRGALCRTLHPRVLIQRDGDVIKVLRQSDAKLDKSLHGLSRTLIHGYRAQLQNRVLTLQLGHSHPIAIEAPDGIDFELNRTLITVRGFNKELVGQVAANIRMLRKPEPYKGKGIKYTTEIIRRKVGKAG